MGDAPAAILPNGDALLTMSPLGLGSTYPPPTLLYEYNPTLNVFTNVTPPASVLNQISLNSFNDAMLVLPSANGQPQLLLTSGTVNLAFYNLAPGDGPAPGWAPTITSFTKNANGTYTLTGTQLNGLDEGAAYGDDKQMAENFPIVQLTNIPAGTVYYATTSNWSSTGVATGNTPQTVTVTLPALATSIGLYSVVVFADGIPSQPIVHLIGRRLGGGSVVPNGTLPSLANAGQLTAAGAPAAPGANDVSSSVSVVLTPVVTDVMPRPSSSVQFGSDNAESTLAIGSPSALTTALDKAEAIHIAGLAAALDILNG
jgi:hypothetical protein